MDLTRMKSRTDQSAGSWTHIRRDPLPMGDALYTIKEIPEDPLATSRTGIEAVLVNGSATLASGSNSNASSFMNIARPWSSTTLSDPPSSESAQAKQSSNNDRSIGEHLTPQISQLDLKPVTDAVEKDLVGSSLDYWKTRLETMETQKRDIRQWMAETTTKISDAIQRMKVVTERLHKELIDESLDENSSTIKSEPTKTESMSTFLTDKSECTNLSEKSPQQNKSRGSSGDGLSVTSKKDSISSITSKNGSITSQNESITDHTKEGSPSSQPVSSSLSEGAESFKDDSKYTPLNFNDLPKNQKQAEETLRNENQVPFLKMMADITDEWDLVKTVYISMKRTGSIQPLDLYKLTQSVLETNSILRQKMENFLSSHPVDSSEMVFKFGKGLLTVYHITIVLNSDSIPTEESTEEKSCTSNVSSQPKKRDGPTSSRKPSKNRRQPTQINGASAAERIIRKQNEMINKMFRASAIQDIKVPSNPSYAHVKSRYMKILPRPQSTLPKRTIQTRRPSKPKTACVDQRPKVKIQRSADRIRSSWTSSRLSLSQEEWGYREDTLTTDRETTTDQGSRTITPQASKSRNMQALHTRDKSPVSSSSSSHQYNSTETVVKRDVTHTIRTRSESPYRSAEDITEISVDSTRSISESITEDLPRDQPDIAIVPSVVGLDERDPFEDLSCGDASQLFFRKLGQDRKETTKTKMTITNNGKSNWKVPCKPNKDEDQNQMRLSRTTSRFVESIRPNSRASTEPEKIECVEKVKNITSPSRVPTFAVLAQDKYVCVKLTNGETNRDPSPSRYDLAEDTKHVGVIRTLYRNLPSLQPYIVDMLLTNIVFAYLISVAGEAFCGPKSSMACNIPEALKNKLRTMLIRALRLVDDF